MNSMKRLVILLILWTLAGTACAPSSGGDDDELDLEGTWSGSFQDSASGPLFAHPSTGTISVTFTESLGKVSGNIMLIPDICDDVPPQDPTSGTITGTLSGTTLQFEYDTPAVSSQPAKDGRITFTAPFPATPIQGQYDATPCHSDAWRGQFVLTKQ
jgi:hypothetical protein